MRIEPERKFFCETFYIKYSEFNEIYRHLKYISNNIITF